MTYCFGQFNLSLILIWYSLFFLSAPIIGHEEEVHENLFIYSLRNGDLLTSFNFTIRSNLSSADASLRFVSSLFHRIFDDHDIRHLQLTFTQGFWRDNKWGNHRNANTPSGTQLLIRFGSTVNKRLYSRLTNLFSVDERWSMFLHQLNGIFCTSMLEMNPTLTATPTLFVRYSSRYSLKNKNKGDNNEWRYGSLPSETLCSENLKTWKRLLPCKQRGLVSLLEPRNLLASNFHSLTLTIDRHVEGKNTYWLFELGANTVHRGRLRDKRYWSLQNIFAKRLVTKCGVSNSAQIYVEKSNKWNMKPMSDVERVVDSVVYHVYDLHKWNGEETFAINAEIVAPREKTNVSDAISIQSFATSSSQVFGVLRTRITNPHADDLPIIFAQMIPWQIRLYLHTLNVRCRVGGSNAYADVQQKQRRFQLAKNAERPLLVEFAMKLPAGSICEVSADYEAAFLKVTSFPADANSGVYIPGSIVTLLPLKDSFFMRHLVGVKLYGEPLLILLPVPDFSMPFNVIVIVCSLIAMFYGNIFTLTTKIMKPIVKKDTEKPLKPSAIYQRLQYVWDRMCSIFGRKIKEE